MTPVRFGWFSCIVIFVGLLRAHSQSAEPKSTQDWAAYGGNQEKTHYSALAQINKSNVKRLEVAWSYDTEETGGLQTSPIEIAGTLYGISPSQKLFALDAATGKLKWKFDSGVVGTQPDRGLVYWSSPNNKDHRIIVGVMNFVYALDAGTGQPIASFGDHGRIDLREGLGRDVATAFIALTSPAVVYKDLFIVGADVCQKPCRPSLVISVRTTFARENSGGVFTPFRTLVSLAMRRGRKTRGRKAARPTTGRE
jgi:glucose dehydrogenase